MTNKTTHTITLKLRRFTASVDFTDKHIHIINRFFVDPIYPFYTYAYSSEDDSVCLVECEPELFNNAAEFLQHAFVDSFSEDFHYPNAPLYIEHSKKYPEEIYMPQLSQRIASLYEAGYMVASDIEELLPFIDDRESLNILRDLDQPEMTYLMPSNDNSPQLPVLI